MKKRIIAALMASVVAVSMLAGCGGVQKLGAVWGNVWTTRIQNSVFGDYNPYTTFVCGD